MTESRRSQIKLGLTSCVFHNNAVPTTFNGRPLLYMEQSMGTWLMSAGALVYLIPFTPQDRPVPVTLRHLMEPLDGLVIAGGVDMAPTSYGEDPLRPEWSGDVVRDRYEMELARICLDTNKPVLGVCRGHQVLNVTLGGTLYQDIATQLESTFAHRDAGRYEQNKHHVEIVPNSRLSAIYGGIEDGVINSVHHQAIKDLGEGLIVEARSKLDGVIEAVRLKQTAPLDPYAVGVQWHPEFQDPDDSEILSQMPILSDFLAAIEHRIQIG